MTRAVVKTVTTFNFHTMLTVYLVTGTEGLSSVELGAACMRAKEPKLVYVRPQAVQKRCVQI
jgi:hypothetical protein